MINKAVYRYNRYVDSSIDHYVPIGGAIINFEDLAAKSGNIERPEKIIARERLTVLKDTEGLAIGEIAGRDSVAAIIKACETHNIDAVLPTIVFTGTEYGDWNSPLRNIGFLKNALGTRCTVFEPVFLGNPELWAALSGKYATVIAKKLNIYSPCLACHLYMHLCRVPLAKSLDKTPIISGERDSHQGVIKLSQTPRGIDASVEVLAYAGIELLLPIRHLEDNAEIEQLIGSGWEQGQRQLECVLSGNYADLGAGVVYDEIAHRRYLDEFLIPSGKAVIDAWRTSTTVDYSQIVGDILKNIVGTQA